MTNLNDFTILHAPGSCGSFVWTIFSCYAESQGVINQQIGDGDASIDQAGTNANLVHWPHEIPTNKKVVVIDFDDADKKAICRMYLHKNLLNQLSESPDVLAKSWDGKYKDIDPTNVDLLEKIILDNIDDFIFPAWKQMIGSVEAVLTIQFKDIMFGDLNKIIADFFQKTPLPEVEAFIQHYRSSNEKYFVD
jgi:hypothetical protein